MDQSYPFTVGLDFPYEDEIRFRLYHRIWTSDAFFTVDEIGDAVAEIDAKLDDLEIPAEERAKTVRDILDAGTRSMPFDGYQIRVYSRLVTWLAAHEGLVGTLSPNGFNGVDYRRRPATNGGCLSRVRLPRFSGPCGR
ncbi:hypothetical protein [Caenispirillum bisanense]|uniref:Uncharacterized protein n=1 Tax=Caenispirillum bisanense TaxID=414052 RepID=A0A286GLX3_9PROT|nr:hypothetical protein [Caenispirillum bisanense]SOD96545.1 hypothetical protein SAMN05421508_105406 [Caenispirillum bisanense]